MKFNKLADAWIMNLARDLQTQTWLPGALFMEFSVKNVIFACLKFSVNLWPTWISFSITVCPLSLSTGSFSFSVLSGKVMFRDVYFINKDMSIRCLLLHYSVVYSAFYIIHAYILILFYSTFNVFCVTEYKMVSLYSVGGKCITLSRNSMVSGL